MTDYTMESSVSDLEDQVVGHRIVEVEKGFKVDNGYSWNDTGTALTLDNGTKVVMLNTSDCCAYTELQSFLEAPDMVDHIITVVSTNDDYTTWHIFADMGDVLKLDVGWSEGSGYYGYGFEIMVINKENDK